MSEPVGHVGRAVTVSAVIPAFNRAGVIRECVTSVLNQTHEHLEVIVVDDGSTDDTRQALEPLLEDDRLRYVYQENAGAGAARNKGVAVSSGPLVAFLDSDDLWRPGKLTADVEFLTTTQEADAVFSDVQMQERATDVPYVPRQFPRFSRVIANRDCTDGALLPQRAMFLCLLQELPVKTPTVTMRREAFERVGGFDESIVSGQDWEMFLRFSRQHRYGYIDRPFSIVRTSVNSLHINAGVRATRAVWRVLLNERARLEGDSEAQAAATWGVSYRCKRTAWLHLENGENRAAIKAYLDGFWDTRDPGLLARAVASLLPGGSLRSARWLGWRSGRVPAKPDQNP